METLKGMRSFLLGVVIFIGLVVGAIFVLALGVKASGFIAPYVGEVALVLFIANIITLLWAISPKARGVVSVILFLSSYVYGLAGWIYGLLVTLTLWGWLAIIIGLFLGGVGVVPIGMLASIFHGRWDIFFSLLVLVLATYGTRVIAIALSDNFENQKHREDDQVIELEAENIDKRSWKDFE